jgi:Tol biopolymer transport system component
VKDTPGEEGIYAVSRNGGVSRQLTDSLPLAVRTYEYRPRFDLSPDGRTLAYSAKLGEEQALFTLPVSGGEQQLLVRFESQRAQKRGTLPQWSPDSSQLAYTDGSALCVIAAAGGEPCKLSRRYYWHNRSVRWSPDGKLIAALCRPTPKLKDAVFVVPASGGELRQLTSADAAKKGLDWHPDGQRLTYSLMRSDSETYQAYLDGREPTLLLNVPDIYTYVGTWAPDGRRYFFLCFVAQGVGMYVYDESSSKTTQVSVPGNLGVPRFSRDGKTMAWWETRKASIQTWIMEDFLPESTGGE